MDTLTSIRVFSAVAELRSFAAAADRLDISPAMASKHVMHLEQRVASRLLNRTTRHVSLTEAGALYLEQARQLLEGLDEAEAAVAEITTVPRGKLRFSAPPWFANPAFARMLAEFVEQYPQVRIELDLSGRTVRLVDEGYDLALRASPPEALDPGLIARRLAEIEFHLAASADYLRRTGAPRSLGDLHGRPLLLYSGIRSDGAIALEGPHGTETVKFDVVFESGNEAILRQLAIDGAGLIFAPTWTLQPELESGRLELVLPETLHPAGQLYAVYPSKRHLSAKVRAFVDFMAHDKRLERLRKIN